MQLSEHFTLAELTNSETAARNGWDNTPNADELANLKRLAEFLEEVCAVICDSAHECLEVLDEEMEVAGIGPEDITDIEEVFEIGDGRYLIVEG